MEQMPFPMIIRIVTDRIAEGLKLHDVGVMGGANIVWRHPKIAKCEVCLKQCSHYTEAGVAQQLCNGLPHPLQGTVNGGAISKWPCCRLDVKHNQPNITLHNFCRVIHQIGYEMKRRVIAEDHIIWLKSEPLWSNLSHCSINFLRLHIFLRLAVISQKFLNMFKMLERPALPYDY